MLRVGLTGGLACGKTFVGEALASFGCYLIQADVLGHEVLAPGGEAYETVISEFGSDILGPGGEIERSVLAARVFSDAERLARLSAIVHPLVVRREEELITAFRARDPHGIVVVEAAILIETGGHKRFDRMILVTCGEEQQMERALRRGVPVEDVRARMSRQMPLAEKRKFADFVIDTSGDRELTLRQARTVYEALRSIES